METRGKKKGYLVGNKLLSEVSLTELLGALLSSFSSRRIIVNPKAERFKQNTRLILLYFILINDKNLNFKDMAVRSI